MFRSIFLLTRLTAGVHTTPAHVYLLLAGACATAATTARRLCNDYQVLYHSNLLLSHWVYTHLHYSINSTLWAYKKRQIRYSKRESFRIKTFKSFLHICAEMYNNLHNTTIKDFVNGGSNLETGGKPWTDQIQYAVSDPLQLNEMWNRVRRVTSALYKYTSFLPGLDRSVEGATINITYNIYYMSHKGHNSKRVIHDAGFWYAQSSRWTVFKE